MSRSIGGVKVRRTGEVFDENSRIAAFVFAPTGYRKTRFGATLDELTRKHLNKPTLFIAAERGEGGGTTSIRDSNVEFTMPERLDEIESILADLRTDTYYGGVVMDSASDLVRSYLLPWSLKMPARENPVSRSKAGVPSRDDYQNMGEKLRQYFVQLINLTTIGGNEPSAKDVDCRKHVYVTALQRQKFDNDTGRLTSTGPDLPGQMADMAASMFQLSATIDFDYDLVEDEKNPKLKRRVERPVLATSMPIGKYQVKDRYGLFPERGPLNWLELYEQYWLPALSKQTTE